MIRERIAITFYLLLLYCRQLAAANCSEGFAATAPTSEPLPPWPQPAL